MRGITARLDYLSELGVNCLWLTPIFPAPSHHGYDPTDYFAIEPRLGSAADFQALVAAAHGRGLRVVLDFVANHLSRQHPAFVAAQADPASPTREWFFFRDYPQTYEAFYDVPDQPVVNTDQPAVRDYLIRSAQHWLQLGCDGFRLDHAHGATHGFWSALRAATRAVKADAAIFGEITDTPALMRSYTGRMDGVLDFPLLELLRGFFVFQSIGVSQLDRALQQHFAYFGSELVLPSFLDNHDMNRFLWSVGGDTRRLKLAALCQFTLPQPPILYYGTEVGLSQRQGLGRLEEARLPMLWDEQQDRDLLDFYRRLIQLRRQTSGTWSGPRTTVVVDDEQGLYAYRCGAYLVALNNQDRDAAVACPATELILSTDPGVDLLPDLLRLPPLQAPSAASEPNRRVNAAGFGRRLAPPKPQMKSLVWRTDKGMRWGGQRWLRCAQRDRPITRARRKRIFTPESSSPPAAGRPAPLHGHRTAASRLTVRSLGGCRSSSSLQSLW